MPADGDLRLRSDVSGARVDVTVGGELDMAAAFKLETELDGLLAAPDTQAVVLDLADVTFIDSAGLGSLLAIRERAKQLGIELAIARVSDRVQRILEATGLGDIAEH
ncbi:MAG TPA: STAS domain-containing protein [Solirubrobacter sp.]|nr:STAS domain-containing protein [Solirubrobacter sp.]